MSATVRSCVWCRGGGCAECEGTGNRHTTVVEVGRVSAIVHGSFALSADARGAIAAVLEVAAESAASERRQELLGHFEVLADALQPPADPGDAA